MIHAYVYKVTHLASGQYYFGSRTANVRHNRLPEKDLWVSYFTSSNTVKRLIAESGPESFTPEIVFTSESFDEVYWVEQYFIKNHIADHNCLNKKYQDKETGNTVFSTAGKPSWNKGVPSKYRGIPRPAHVVEKMRENRKGKGTGTTPKSKGTTLSVEQRQQISQRMKGKYSGDKNPFYGKTHSDEVRQLIAENTSKHQRGRVKPKTHCPHCGLLCAAHTMGRHLQIKHGA